MAGGGPISQLQSQQQTPMGGGSSPLNTGGGMSGGQTQLPNFAAPQQQPMQQQPFGGQQPVQLPMQPFGGQQPMQQQQRPHTGGQMANPLFDQFAQAGRVNDYYQYMRQLEQQRPGSNMFGQPQPMQNPFQPQQPSFMQDPEYQGYQTQANDLQRQMNEYMQKAPMYQQLQDLQGKMAPFQQRYQQQQMQQRQFQQPSPFRRGQFQQPMGLQGLMGMLGGSGSGRDIGSYEQYVDRNNRALASASQEVKQPTMSRAEWQAMSEQSRQPRMSMDMPQRNSFYKNGGKV